MHSVLGIHSPCESICSSVMFSQCTVPLNIVVLMYAITPNAIVIL